MSRFTLCLLASVAFGCGGRVETEAPRPCDGHTFIEMAVSELPCDGSAPACAFDSSYQPTELNGDCEAFEFTCDAGHWSGVASPKRKTYKGECAHGVEQ